MNIFLTFDYELFFGTDTGSVEKCLIKPTNELLQIAKKHQIKMVFFVDVGYLIKLEEFKSQFPELELDHQKVTQQIEQIIKEGHDIQLHIHPHWEKSFFAEGKWQMATKNAYKLSDFSDYEAEQIVVKYKSYLDNLVGYKTHTFRAGGWCIQPFSQLQNIFKKLNIKYDSSVFSGAKFVSPEYNIDFTSAPKKSVYSFEEDVCVENKTGFFTEFPISSMRYNPLFFWRLYIWGRLLPSQHKMLGDGNFLAQPGRKWHSLTHFSWNHISSDGYFATKMLSFSTKAARKNKKNIVIIGHPKSATRYSLKKLDHFIKKTKHKFNYTIFSALK